MLCILFCGLGQMAMVRALVVALEKAVNGCELMSATKLFGSPLELYHQVLSPPCWWGLLPQLVNQNPCRRELRSSTSVVEKILSITLFARFYFIPRPLTPTPRRWTHRERAILLIRRRTLLSGWKIIFWKLNKWALLPTLLVIRSLWNAFL